MNSSYNLHQNLSGNSSLGFLPNQTSLRPNLDWLLEIKEIQRIVDISSVSLLAVISLFCNVSLLAIFIKYKDMRTTTNFFIINMVISDLLYVIFVIPPILEQRISGSEEWRVGGAFGMITCKLAYFIRDISFTVSILSMVAIALDRFYAVVYPLKRKPRCLGPRFSIPAIWLIATGPFVIYFYIARLLTSPVQKDTYYCLLIWTPAFDQVKSPRRLYLFVVVAFFIVPLVFIAVFYSSIIYKLRNRSIPGVRTSESEKIRHKRNRSITKVGAFIVLCFFFSWAPYHCLSLIVQFQWNYNIPLHLFKLINWLYFIFETVSTTSIASNACVLYACSSRFRNCLRKMLISCPSRSPVSDRCRSNSGQDTQSFRFQGNKVKIEGAIIEEMSTGQTIELESGWETKL